MPEIKVSDERMMAAFVDKMITDKNPEVGRLERMKLRRVLGEQLESRVEQAMLMALPDEQLNRLNELLDADAEDSAIEDAFNSANVDFSEAVEKALWEFRDQYLRDGDNATLIEQADQEKAAFLETAPDGQGVPPEMTMPEPATEGR